jgi:hypothetical protein
LGIFFRCATFVRFCDVGKQADNADE